MDFQSPPAMTGHWEVSHPGARRPGHFRDLDEARLAVGDRPERLADDDRRGAAPTDPADEAPVRRDHRLRAGLRRRRPLGPHDRRRGEWLATREQLRREGEEAVA